MTRRRALVLGAAAIAMPSVARRALAAKTPVLVELFTSQGCSLCPPADEFAGELAKRDEVIVVSLNVDYWDYLGWKDTLARPEYSKRQMDYAKSRGDGDVYTPQMVINGASHAVGSQKAAVESAILAATPVSIPISFSSSGEEISVEVAASDSDWHGTLWIMPVVPKAEVVIERGENTGRTIAYHNIVKQMTPAGMYKGKAMNLVLPRHTITSPDCKSCVVVLQEGMTGPVRGVVRHMFADAT